MLRPERSENGKNEAKKSKMRPQKTVFWAREKRFNKSLHIRSKLFRLFGDVQIQSSSQIARFCSTYENIASHCSNVTESNTSPKFFWAIKFRMEDCERRCAAYKNKVLLSFNIRTSLCPSTRNSIYFLQLLSDSEGSEEYVEFWIWVWIPQFIYPTNPMDRHSIHRNHLQENVHFVLMNKTMRQAYLTSNLSCCKRIELLSFYRPFLIFRW